MIDNYVAARSVNREILVSFIVVTAKTRKKINLMVFIWKSTNRGN
jgi:hypothetical protein